ncbi:protein of unknown function [Xenorhabdus poinarii G6]|uniref:Uncharacterized protein n=1 Tax=Xenorhabdus poinarii G6 TaxID=1354304 RepID=A0A068R4D8_9GAMM|nr:protein of unknown function [Xenorhabdus poinarii G6]
MITVHFTENNYIPPTKSPELSF